MILTEEEAKTKWCPEARQLVEIKALQAFSEATTLNATSCNRHGDNPYGTCIGSTCMAWRWHGMRDKEGHVYTAPQALDAAHGRVPINDDSVPVGYCGKAGAP